MNKKVETVKGLVKQLRIIRDKMNSELENMTFEERMQYFKSMRLRTNSPQH